MDTMSQVARHTLPPRVAYADGVVYASQGRLFALSAEDGRMVTEYDIHSHQAVAVVEGVIYAGVTTKNECGDLFSAYQATDAATGACVWTAPVHGRPYFAPLVTEDSVLVAVVEGTLYSLDRATGQLRWRYRPHGFHIAGPVMAGGVAYFSPVVNEPEAAFVYALDASSGRLMWRAGLPATTHTRLAVHRDSLYAAAPNGGGLLALDRHTGARLWWRPPVADPVSCPVVTEGILSLVCARTRFDPAALAASSSDTLPDPFTRSVELIGMRAEDGGLLWEQPIGSGDGVTHAGEPSAGAALFCVGADDGALYAFDSRTGAPRWTCTSGGEQTSEALVVNGTVYFGASDGNVYALSAATGELRWRAFTSMDLYAVVRLSAGPLSLDRAGDLP